MPRNAETFQTVTALQGECLDALVWRIYGTTDGRLVEQVLDLNPGLAATAAALAEGQAVTLPVITAAPPAQRDIVQLWS
jgi:phage tail protein X